MRRLVLSVAILILITPCDGALAAERPNFVLLIADDVSWDDIGCYGHPSIRTPNIDKLAKGGMRFDAAFLVCSSCSPSRCSILTGRYPHATGAAELHQPLPKDQVTFIEKLRAAGYYTAIAGKTHIGKPTEAKFDKVNAGGGESGCEKFVATLKERPRDKPFFLWLAAVDAHRDFKPGAVDPPHTEKDVVVPPYLPDVPETRRDLALYYDEIARWDSYVGKVVAELEAQKVLENTVIIVMADNGRAFPRCKTTVYDSGVKTPFIVHWPAKVKAGQSCENLISSIDLAPTVLELAGVDRPDAFQGVSFAKLLGDPKAAGRECVFAEHNWHDYEAHKRAVRSTKYLYIRNDRPALTLSPPADAVRSITYQAMIKLRDAGKLDAAQMQCFVKPRPAEELYDVVNDPHQLTNLAADSSHSRALDEMRGVLKAWAAEMNDSEPRQLTPDKYDRETGLPPNPSAKKKTK